MSWLTKQFRSAKKRFIPKEVRKPFTAIGKMVPNEVTGFWDDAMEGSKQIAEAIGFGGQVRSDNTKREEAAVMAQVDAANAEPVTLMADADELKRRRRRSAQRKRGLGRASTVLGGDAETLG